MTGELDATVWSRFDHDPRVPAHRHLRAADRDRDVISEVLTEAFAQGRLDRDELDERQDQLRDTRTLGELPALVRDLVSDQVVAVRRPSSDLRAEAEAQYRRRLTGAMTSFLVPTLICWFIYFWSGGFPWPLFVTIGTAIGPLHMIMSGKAAQVAQIQQQLEDDERRNAVRRQRRLGGPGPGQLPS